MAKIDKRKMRWDKHEEVKLVHKVKQEVGSKGELRYIAEWSVIFREELVDGLVSMTTEE